MSTISNQPNAKRQSRAGACPKRSESLSGGSSKPINFVNPVHGLRIAQRLPKAAQMNVKAVQSKVQTVSGSGLARGSLAPVKPMTTRASQKRRPARLRMVSMRGSENSAIVHSLNRLRSNFDGVKAIKAKDSATATVPATCMVSVGRSSTKPRPDAWANASPASNTKKSIKSSRRPTQKFINPPP